MARTRQQAKQRKAKRLEQQRKQAEQAAELDRSSGGDSANQEALDEVEQAQLNAAAELEEAQDTEVGAGAEAARSAAAMEAAAGAEAATTGEVTPPQKERARTKTRSERRALQEERAAEQRRSAEAEKKQRPKAQADRKEPRRRGRVLTFFVQVVAELRRVQWPNRSQVTQATTVVIVFCLIAGAYLGVLDYFAKKLIKLIL